MWSDLAGFVCVAALGVYAGANLTEAGVLAPWWRAVGASEFYAWYRQNDRRLFRFFFPLNAAALLSCVPASLAIGSHFRLALGLVLACVLMFPIYFAAANQRLSAGELPAPELAKELERWSRLHWLRTGLSLAAFAAGLAAVID